MATIRQTPSVSTTIDGSGRGQVTFGPVPTFTRWLVGSVSVSVTGTTVGARASVHTGDSPSDANFVEGTETGERDASFYPNALELAEGDRLHVVWTGAVPGDTARATLRVQQVPDAIR